MPMLTFAPFVLNRSCFLKLMIGILLFLASLTSLPAVEGKKEPSPQSLYQTALQKLDGKTLRQDYHGAIRLLTQSAEVGHVPSLILLSACCMEGIGIPRNTDAAMQLMARAAQKDSGEAQRRLALFYYEGIGIPRDKKSAFYWFKKAADNKDPLGLYFLGTFYSQGIEVKLSESKALDCFLDAAYLNEPHAQVMLAGCYAKGYGTSQDYAEAFAWALVAANNGFPETKNQLYPLMPQRALDKGRERATSIEKKLSKYKNK